jgi:ATP-dependent RNA helicase DDX19/DBP5
MLVKFSPQSILDALILDMRFEVPSEIQAVTIPRIVKGKNIIAQAQTGSGKTIAFVIGMLCAVDVTQNCVQALCLTPTRELAIQIIDDAVIPLSKRMEGIMYELLIPDEPGKQSKPRGSTCTSHIVVGTPGTIKGSIARKYLKNLKTVKVFVCDEADTMVDQRELGQDTVQIKSQLSPNVQTLFFSATYTDTIISFSKALMTKAAVVKLKTNTDLLLSNIFQVQSSFLI